jgi:hypothetical protein
VLKCFVNHRDFLDLSVDLGSGTGKGFFFIKDSITQFYFFLISR